MIKTQAKKTVIKKHDRKFPVLYLIFISIFGIIVTLYGISRIKKTITFRDTNAFRKLTLGELLDGILRMDENNKLAISSEQSRKILPYLISVQDYLDDREMLAKYSSEASKEIEETLDEKQMDYLVSNFEPLPPDFVRFYLKDIIIFLKERAINRPSN